MSVTFFVLQKKRREVCIMTYTQINNEASFFLASKKFLPIFNLAKENGVSNERAAAFIRGEVETLIEVSSVVTAATQETEVKTVVADTTDLEPVELPWKEDDKPSGFVEVSDSPFDEPETSKPEEAPLVTEEQPGKAENEPVTEEKPADKAENEPVTEEKSDDKAEKKAPAPPKKPEKVHIFYTENDFDENMKTVSIEEVIKCGKEKLERERLEINKMCPGTNDNNIVIDAILADNKFPFIAKILTFVEGKSYLNAFDYFYNKSRDIGKKIGSKNCYYLSPLDATSLAIEYFMINEVEEKKRDEIEKAKADLKRAEAKKKSKKKAATLTSSAPSSATTSEKVAVAKKEEEDVQLSIFDFM